MQLHFADHWNSAPGTFGPALERFLDARAHFRNRSAEGTARLLILGTYRPEEILAKDKTVLAMEVRFIFSLS